MQYRVIYLEIVLKTIEYAIELVNLTKCFKFEYQEIYEVLVARSNPVVKDQRHIHRPSEQGLCRAGPVYEGMHSV